MNTYQLNLAMDMPETSCKEQRIKMTENKNHDKKEADGMFECQCRFRQANIRCIVV
jgi:hypothetical protein